MKARYWLMAPPVLAAGLMGFGLATWSARVLTPPARESAQVGFLPAELDLGESPWNTTVPFHAVFANGGERPIVIDDVKTSCGYVAIGEEYAGRTLSPGERVTMEGLFDTEYRVGPAVHRLTVTASGEATYELALSCDVKPTYRLNPARMWFTFDDPSAQPVVLISDDGVEFTGAAADKPWLVPSFDGHTLDVDVDWALVPRGRHRATPNVYTTDRYVTGAQLPVTA